MSRAPLLQLVLRSQRGFSLLEVIVVTVIFSILAGIAVSTGFASLQRSRVDAVAMELAGWLNGIHANTTASTFNVAVTCTATFRGAAAYPAASEFTAGMLVFEVDNSADCSPVAANFKIPGNAAGTFLIASPATIKYNLRGNTLVGVATDATSNNMSGLVTNRDIKIFMKNTLILRCIRINFLLGLTSIGSNSAANGVASDCATSSVGSYANEKF